MHAYSGVGSCMHTQGWAHACILRGRLMQAYSEVGSCMHTQGWAHACILRGRLRIFCSPGNEISQL